MRWSLDARPPVLLGVRVRHGSGQTAIRTGERTQIVHLGAAAEGWMWLETRVKAREDVYLWRACVRRRFARVPHPLLCGMGMSRATWGCLNIHISSFHHCLRHKTHPYGLSHVVSQSESDQRWWGGGCFSPPRVLFGKFIFHRELSRLIHNSETSGRGRGVAGWSRAGQDTPESPVTPSGCGKKTQTSQMMGLLLGKIKTPALCDRFMRAGGAHQSLPFTC